MICQVLTALHAIAAPLCVRPGTRAKPENIFIPGGARHARWGSFPKTMGGASVADASRMRPSLVLEQVTFPKRALFGNVASRCYQNGAMTCQLTGARRLHMALEALLIAVTLAKHLKFNGFKNFAGLGLEPRVLSRNNLFLMRSCKFR